MKPRLAAAALAFSLVSGGAHATGAIDCAAPGGEASVSLTIGSLPILSVVGAHITAGDQQWSIGGEGESAIISGQAFGEDDEMRVDFTDPNVETVVTQLRLFSAFEGKDSAMAGIVRIPGVGAYALVCTGP